MSFFISIHFSSFAKARVSSIESPDVRVRLAAHQSKLDFEALGLQIYGREQVYHQISIPRTETTRIERVSISGEQKWAWKINRGGIEQVKFEPYLILKNVSMQRGGQVYPNEVLLASHGQFFDVIGVLPLEDYLVGVVASEMPLSWPIEALKAQAVAARSYTLAVMRTRAKKIFHVESSILDQVFTHISRHQEESGLTAKAKQAVASTAGLVLTGTRHQIVKAFYHSDCGGKTSSTASVWGYGTSLGTATDSWCPANPRAHWSVSFSEEALAKKLQKFASDPEEHLLALVALRPSEKDRVEKIKIQWTQEEKIILATQFREALGFDQLRSTMFDLKKDQSEGEVKYVFTGQGFGHGVGLCQWGARAQAMAGRSYTDILKHYYPRAQTELLKTRLAQQFEKTVTQ
jgi:stage II sporulation protein D